jgi:type IV secretory pathway TrbL component
MTDYKSIDTSAKTPVTVKIKHSLAFIGACVLLIVLFALFG